MDPYEGPLTDSEFEDLQAKIKQAAITGRISEPKLLMSYLMIALGIRPIQIASLKCKDFIQGPLAIDDHLLNVPRAKQKNTLDRSEFRLRKLNRELGDRLKSYIQTLSKKHSKKNTNIADLPMFPKERQHRFPDGPGFEFHCTAQAIGIKISRALNSLDLNSERLNGKTPITPVRLRRSFATRAAEEGWSSLIIAELMDHTDTRHVEVYAGLTTKIKAKFSRQIAFDLAPISQAFSGKIIASESDASRPGPSSRIIDLRIDRNGAPIASCGKNSQCDFSRPYACYNGCYDFEPWLDGPHEAALDHMLARREHLLATTDSKIAAINDRSILGCAQVILRCRELLEKK
ncbi:hypothetical protein GCM10017655_48390 [Pseudomonas turukhanskensis]|uniref:Tyr recombinase domain-containing protein n=2 Tax=Pseudomonas turukhanskensis TaxID=1806536 RepID=A0A9W6KCN9_9PSED|nr:hypothetical protein GCM10017655_48390 [Pseudomonas turukhanskensis]